jgi:hypothetical protein
MTHHVDSIIKATSDFLEKNLDAHLEDYSVKFRIEFIMKYLDWVLYADVYKLGEDLKVRLIHSESERLEKEPQRSMSESEFLSIVKTTEGWVNYHATFPLEVLSKGIRIMEKIKIAYDSKQMKPLSYITDIKFKEALLNNQ